MDEMQSFTEKRYGENAMIGTDFSNERIDKIISRLPTTGSLLELGAWDGSIISRYRPRFQGKIFGLDLSIEIMKQALPMLEEGKACDLNKDNIPWDDNSFDCVVCGEVIEHIFDTDRLMLEIRRVLKPGGVVFLSTPNLSSALNRLLLLAGLQPLGTEVSSRKSNYGNPLRKSLNPAGHIRNFTARALVELIQANGFERVTLDSAPLSGNKYIRRVEKLFAMVSPSLGSDLIIEAYKK